MIPEMNRKGYDRDFNVAVTTTAATTGLMIPPSNVMIVYSVAGRPEMAGPRQKTVTVRWVPCFTLA